VSAAPLRIMPFEPVHADGVIAVILPIQQTEFGIPITLAEQPDLLDIPGFYGRGDGGFWVALDGDTVVGTIGLLDIGSGEGALRKMFVAPGYRGAVHGAAVRLLQTLLAAARACRMRRIYLGTTAQFLAAHRFYEKHGFAGIDRVNLPAAFPVMTVDTRFYVREP
jgi:GNAT superfamily N-acetyltransferase